MKANFRFFAAAHRGAAVHSGSRNKHSLAWVFFPARSCYVDYVISDEELKKMEPISEEEARKRFPKMFAAIEKKD